MDDRIITKGSRGRAMKKTEKLLKDANPMEPIFDEDYWLNLETKIMTEVAKTEMEPPPAHKKTPMPWAWKSRLTARTSWMFVGLTIALFGGWKFYSVALNPKLTAESMSVSLVSSQSSSDFFMDIARETIDDQSIDELEAHNL